jgi:selenocysteine lyase/cysteine desulfurase
MSTDGGVTVDWTAVRAEFPAVDRVCYLDTAAGGPLSRAAAEAGTGYYRTSLEEGDLHWEEWADRVETIRARLAGYLGCSAGELAFVANASAGMNLVAQMLWGQGKVVAIRGDFPSVTLPWLQLGYEVDFVDPAEDGTVDTERIAAAVDAQTAVLTLGSVHYQSGFRHDLRELGAYCRAQGLLLVVDATQQAGAVRVDLSGDEVDFLVCSAYKWLTAGYGIGFLYVNRRHLHAEAFPGAGWRSARIPYDLLSDRLDLSDSAVALELGNPLFPGVFTLGAAIELFERIGPAAIEGRVLGLSARLASGLRGAGHGVVTPETDAHRAGIVSARVPEPARMAAALAARGVMVSARGDLLRASAHLYNSESDVDRLLRELAALA